jgi:transposase-like protein
VLIVDTDVVRVERQLRAGELTCPSCGAVLAPWGHGRPREIRGDLGARLFVRPRRSRCTGCRVTHVLLPEMLWPRRADAAEVIGAGLEIAALGMGHRQVAALLGLADGTVRGWIRRFRRRSEDVRRYFTVALVALADDPVMPEPAACPVSDAVSVITAAHRAAAMKWPEMHTVSRWAFAGRAIDGRVLTCTPSAS